MYEHKMLYRWLRIENTLHELAPKKEPVKGQYIRSMNRGTSVGIAIRLRAGQRRNSGSILGSIRRVFYFSKRPGRLGGQPPTLNPRSICCAVKWSWSEADHSCPSRAKVRNEWNGIATPLYAFMVSTKTTFFNISFMNYTHVRPVAGLTSYPEQSDKNICLYILVYSD